MFGSSALGEVYKVLCAALQPIAGEQAATEARIILETRAQVQWSDIIASPERIIDAQILNAIEQDLKTRINAQKPLSRIYGMRGFWGLDFEVSEHTLDPRPDTEIIIERALELYKENPPQMILDLGTGTGCILISLLHEFRNARGIAVDRSFAALKTAQQNAKRHGCEDRISFICGSWADALTGKFDLIVSNPPYIVSGIIPHLDPEVKNHDPILALDGGFDGLDAYKIIFSSLKNILFSHGKALFEIGYDQGESVLRLAEESGLCGDAMLRDLAGQPRLVEISCGDK